MARQRSVLWIIRVRWYSCCWLWLRLLLDVEFWLRVVIPVPNNFPGERWVRERERCLNGSIFLHFTVWIGGVPKCASNALILVVVLWNNLIDSIILLRLLPYRKRIGEDRVPLELFYALLFALDVLACQWFCGHRIMQKLILCLLFFKKISNSRALKTCASTQCLDLCMQWNWHYSFK